MAKKQIEIACQKEDWHGECCCTCRYRLNDYSHPHTDGKRVTHQRGYVCANPEMGGVFSGWPEHGTCEMWAAKLSTQQEG